MIGLLLVLLLGIGLIIGISNYSTQVGQGTNVLLYSLGVTIDKSVYMLFTYLILLTPVIALILPVYILRSRNLKALTFGAIYGIAIFVILGVFGIYNNVFNAFIMNYHASFISISGLKAPFLLISSYIQGVYGAIVDSSIVEHLRKKFKHKKNKRRKRK